MWDTTCCTLLYLQGYFCIAGGLGLGTSTEVSC